MGLHQPQGFGKVSWHKPVGLEVLHTVVCTGDLGSGAGGGIGMDEGVAWVHPQQVSI